MKTYWHHHPETIDRLAAEYALGTMATAARRRFTAIMQERPDITRAVWAWHESLSGAIVAQTPLPVDPSQWKRLESRLFAPVSTASPKTSSTSPPPGSSWWSRWFAPLPAGALAFGLVLGLVMPSAWNLLQNDAQHTQLPESYVGVLATAQGQPGLIVSSLRKGFTVDLKQLSPIAPPSGATLFLWSIDKSGAMHAIAPIPNGRFVSARLSESAEKTFLSAVELAVSIEPLAATPRQPSGAFVYRGLCGKLWRPPGA